MEIVIPAMPLRAFIKHFVVIENDEELINCRLPDTTLFMAFRYKGCISYAEGQNITKLPSAAITGLRNTPRIIHYAKNSGNIIVQFTETGAAHFFRQPLNQSFGVTLPLNDLVNAANVACLEEQLAVAQNTLVRIQLISQFLQSRLYEQKTDRMIIAALNYITLANGVITISDLANRLCSSQDAFEKKFRKAIGCTPKQYTAITRMKFIVNQGLGAAKLATLALEAGYFDQPHFNNDFKKFTGQTPNAFFQSPYYW